MVSWRLNLTGYQVVVTQRDGTVTRLYSMVSWGLNLTGYQVLVVQRAAYCAPLQSLDFMLLDMFRFFVVKRFPIN